MKNIRGHRGQFSSDSAFLQHKKMRNVKVDLLFFPNQHRASVNLRRIYRVTMRGTSPFLQPFFHPYPRQVCRELKEALPRAEDSASL